MHRVVIFFLFILTLPVQGVISLGILLTSGFPVLFTQKRVGKNSKQFILIKFRTMIYGADRMQKIYRSKNEADGAVFKIRDDPRFTRIGKFLSHTGLDELPQLWNVVRGDMNLFGPRPLPTNEANKLKAWQKKRHEINPGIISPWILEGYHRTSFDDWMKSDVAYSQKKSVLYDLTLFGQSIFFMLRLVTKELGL